MIKKQVKDLAEVGVSVGDRPVSINSLCGGGLLFPSFP